MAIITAEGLSSSAIYHPAFNKNGSIVTLKKISETDWLLFGDLAEGDSEGFPNTLDGPVTIQQDFDCTVTQWGGNDQIYSKVNEEFPFPIKPIGGITIGLREFNTGSDVRIFGEVHSFPEWVVTELEIALKGEIYFFTDFQNYVDGEGGDQYRFNYGFVDGRGSLPLSGESEVTLGVKVTLQPLSEE